MINITVISELSRQTFYHVNTVTMKMNCHKNLKLSIAPSNSRRAKRLTWHIN